MAVKWPFIKIGGKRVPYIPFWLIFSIALKPKKKKGNLTQKESQEKI